MFGYGHGTGTGIGTGADFLLVEEVDGPPGQRGFGLVIPIGIYANVGAAFYEEQNGNLDTLHQLPDSRVGQATFPDFVVFTAAII